MTRMRPLLQVLVAIVMIAAGFMLSDAHAHPGHAFGVAAHAHGMAAQTHGAAPPTVAVGDTIALADGDHGADSDRSHPGQAHAGCCCAGPCCVVLAAPVGLPVRAAHPARLTGLPADPAHPDALSEALPRPPRSIA
ncbi:hypothetical protein [Methylobacterium oryzisoli]|uniref:hypothetical protein n=1 Tax=Methylobacterium oryzisoli TaxID=3385502 RepID=UPI00389291CD